LIRGRLALATAAFFFGATFVVVKDAVEDLTPTAFLALRFTVGALVLLPFAPVRSNVADGPDRGWRPIALVGSVVGVVLGLGYLLQTAGLQFTSASTSAFITGLLVAFTPLLAAIFLRVRLTFMTAAGIVLAIVGLFALTGGPTSFNRGDLLTLGCAVAFAGHIVLLDRFAVHFPVVRFTALQLAVVAAGAALLVPVTGIGEVTARAVGAAVATGIFASALTFALQVAGQRVVPASRAALWLLLEPIFAAIIGYAVGERLGAAGFVGAALILAGTALTERGAFRGPSARPTQPRGVRGRWGSARPRPWRGRYGARGRRGGP